ncbi:MAG TPA: 3-hydroxybutyryl-CoA dehydrogenase [Bacteroidetes bacterium]|nr:3-hydroxybutyryl-CoA dehydrogenase [Bacteroidota bacterium]
MKKTKPPRQKSKRTKSEGGAGAKVYIVGESPMVEEYAELCATKGYSVQVQWNQEPTRKPVFQSSHITCSSAIPTTSALALELTNTDLVRKRQNLDRLDRALPSTAAILSSSVTVTATEQSGWIKQKHRLVGFGVLPTLVLKPLVEVAPTVFSPAETLNVVQRFFHSVGKEMALVQDRVGMVLPRILCQIINEAAFALQEEVASPQDIDTAMKLGTNHPFGPIEWADRIGVGQVNAVLTALQNDLQEDRYRISPLLRHMAQTGEWWKRTTYFIRKD